MRTLTLLGCALVILGCGPDQDYQELGSEELLREQLISEFGTTDQLLLPDESVFDQIPADPNNPLTPEKVRLGKFLFHETGIAVSPMKPEATGMYSCASCHHVQAGFQSGLSQGIAEGGEGFGLRGEGRKISPAYDHTTADIQPIRSPTVLNVAFQEVMLWNGQFGARGMNSGTESAWDEGTPKAVNHLGFEGVETQAIAGLGVHRMNLERGHIIGTAYQALFDEAFPHVPAEERYSVKTAGLAIAAYERSILSNRAPFQRWLRGEPSSMSEKAVEGALLFFGKAKCFECHSGPALNSMSFHALGMKDLDHLPMIGIMDEATIKGRGGFTKNPEDDYTFKTPGLYNLKDRNFFGHGASFRSLQEVLTYKNLAIPENPRVSESRLSPMFRPLGLTGEELQLLEVFLSEALQDPDLDRYTPTATPLGSCFPNADVQSMSDLGCQ